MKLDWTWVNQNLPLIGALTAEHALLALLPAVAGLILAVPLGYVIFRIGGARRVVLALVGLIAAIPLISVLVVMPLIINRSFFDPLSIGAALGIISTMIMIFYVFTGLSSVPGSVNRSALALGYGRVRRLFSVELPLAAGPILGGLRSVVASNIALVTVAVLVGSGSLGRLFTLGLRESFVTPVVIGLVLIIVLAVIVDLIIRLIQRGVTPWAPARQVEG